jgi:hypothetical protein
VAYEREREVSACVSHVHAVGVCVMWHEEGNWTCVHVARGAVRHRFFSHDEFSLTLKRVFLSVVCDVVLVFCCLLT